MNPATRAEGRRTGRRLLGSHATVPSETAEGAIRHLLDDEII